MAQSEPRQLQLHRRSALLLALAGFSLCASPSLLVNPKPTLLELPLQQCNKSSCPEYYQHRIIMAAIVTIPFLPVCQRPYLPSHSAFISSSRPSHHIASRLSFCFAFIPFFVLRLPSLTSSSSFLPFSSFVFLPSRLVSKKDNLFPSPPFQGKGPCIISRLRHPSLLFAPPPDALPCRRQQFHPSSAATYFVSSSTTLSFILISVSYSTTYRSLEDRLFQPILDCLVIRLVLPLPALSPKTTSPAPAFAHAHVHTTTTTTCGSPSFVFCFL